MKTSNLRSSIKELLSNSKNYKRSLEDSNSLMKEDLTWFGQWTNKRFEQSSIKSLMLTKSFMFNSSESVGNPHRIQFSDLLKEKQVLVQAWTKTHQLQTLQNTEPQNLKVPKRNQTLQVMYTTQKLACIKSRTCLNSFYKKCLSWLTRKFLLSVKVKLKKRFSRSKLTVLEKLLI